MHETPAAFEGNGADDLAANAQRDETIYVLKQELRIKDIRKAPPGSQ
ncbi:MAG: hypothetical protein IT384_16110 [Deltaproteobacteria bacterium]|nr:hypothetical protein [Deltaproteobacteria bacterium]